jgi:hypothetical protein
VVAQAQGRMSRRKDGKYFVYLPKSLVEDSAFPFEMKSSVPVMVVIDSVGKKLLITHPTRNERLPKKGY